MNITWGAFSTPKYGNLEDENEDAFAPKKIQKIFNRKSPISFVIADGATQSGFSRLWANLLVNKIFKAHYCPSRKKIKILVNESSKSWAKELASRDLPWFAEEKARLGAFSSLLWITLSESKRQSHHKNSWRAIAIGDSNLFQIRQDKVVCSFPLHESKQFNNFPLLLSSVPSKNLQTWEHICCLQRDWQNGDHFYLMTDALAAWFLIKNEQGENPHRILQQWLSAIKNQQTSFNQVIQYERANHILKNDDTTLIWFCLH